MDNKRKKPKRRKLILLGLLLVFTLAGALFLEIEYFGPRKNQRYGESLLEEMKSAQLPADIKMVDYSQRTAVFSLSQRFEIWTGIAVHTKMSQAELESHIKEIEHFRNAEVYAYDEDLASSLFFTGIQKEIGDGSADGYYLAGTFHEARTKLDRANKTLPGYSFFNGGG